MGIAYIYTLSDYNGIPFYIGQTINIPVRLLAHKNKHGKETVFEVLEEIENEKQIKNETEKFWVEQFRQWGFNLKNKNLVLGVQIKREKRTKWIPPLYTKDKIILIASYWKVDVRTVKRWISDNEPMLTHHETLAILHDKKSNLKFKEEVEIALIRKRKTKKWIAEKMGMSRELFWAKMTQRKKYIHFTNGERTKIRKFLIIRNQKQNGKTN